LPRQGAGLGALPGGKGGRESGKKNGQGERSESRLRGGGNGCHKGGLFTGLQRCVGEGLRPGARESPGGCKGDHMRTSVLGCHNALKSLWTRPVQNPGGDGAPEEIRKMAGLWQGELARAFLSKVAGIRRGLYGTRLGDDWVPYSGRGPENPGLFGCWC